MGYRYIGSKARIADEIIEYVKETATMESGGFFVDAFSGTGVVAEKAAQIGWPVHVNDMMTNAVIMSEARLLSSVDVPFDCLGGYEEVIKVLNSVRWGYKEAYSGKYSVNVFPDIEVVTKDSQLTPLYLLDAKYKLVKNATTGEVERDDLYEAFAFCSATDTNEIVLVYPADDPANIPGHVKKCSTYYVKDVMIHVVQVAFGSIKEKGGIYAFSANLCSGIEAVLKSS